MIQNTHGRNAAVIVFIVFRLKVEEYFKYREGHLLGAQFSEFQDRISNTLVRVIEKDTQSPPLGSTCV